MTHNGHCVIHGKLENSLVAAISSYFRKYNEYADNFLVLFQKEKDAEWVMERLSLRLNKIFVIGIVLTFCPFPITRTFFIFKSKSISFRLDNSSTRKPE